MKDFIYSEKFDDYLKGKLQKNEKLSFEEELRQDPLLRNEVKWQEEIHYALSDARRTYLKNRLDQVPVNSGGWYNFTGMQWAAVVSSFLILAGGTYYYYSQSNGNSVVETQVVSIDSPLPEKNPQVQVEKVQPSPLPQFNEEEYIADDEILTASSEVSVNNSEENISEVNKEVIPHNNKSLEKNLPEIVRPDVLSSFQEESQTINYSDFESPDKHQLQGTASSTSEVEIETVANSKYSFHYQLFNGKLYLHGDFQGIPYKIIALNQDEKKKLFLEFNGNFYKLRELQETITPLELINDSTMINALIKLSR